MSEIWLLFIKKINKTNQLLIKYFSLLSKKIISESRFFSRNSIEKIETKKIKWKLQKKYEELGFYIYDCNDSNGMVDFSNDTDFNEMIKKIKKEQNFLESKNKINTIEK
tara:strand:- start:578 stop:904 length:327 start_codon:yes stop_codon:yes gene_type:complete